MSKGETQILSRLALIREYKKGGCRYHGDENHKGRLEFHHPNKSPRVRISRMGHGWKTMEALRNELEKTVVLCKRHHELADHGKITVRAEGAIPEQFKFSFLKE